MPVAYYFSWYYLIYYYSVYIYFMDNIHFYVTHLHKNKLVINSLLADKLEQEYLWKKTPDKWSLLEIICHLVDEEIEDFRFRLKNVLETPDKKPPAIDPVGWVTSREYQKQNFSEKLSAFIAEREKSIQWLKSLSEENWEHGYKSDHFGHVNGYFFINNWLAHDYLHIRQITRVHYDYLEAMSPVQINYAGKWVAN